MNCGLKCAYTKYNFSYNANERWGELWGNNFKPTHPFSSKYLLEMLLFLDVYLVVAGMGGDKITYDHKILLCLISSRIYASHLMLSIEVVKLNEHQQNLS